MSDDLRASRELCIKNQTLNWGWGKNQLVHFYMVTSPDRHATVSDELLGANVEIDSFAYNCFLKDKYF